MSAFLDSNHANCLAKESWGLVYEVPQTMRLYDLPGQICDEDSSTDVKIRKLGRLWNAYYDMAFYGNDEGYTLRPCKINVSCDDEGFPKVWICKKSSAFSGNPQPDYDFLVRICQRINCLYKERLKEEWKGDPRNIKWYGATASVYEDLFNKYHECEEFWPAEAWPCLVKWLKKVKQHRPKIHPNKLSSSFENLTWRSEELWKNRLGEHRAEFNTLWNNKKVQVFESPDSTGLQSAFRQLWNFQNNDPCVRPTGKRIGRVLQLALSYEKLFSRFATSKCEYDLSPESIEYGISDYGIREIFLRRLEEAKEPENIVPLLIEAIVRNLQSLILEDIGSDCSDLPKGAFAHFDSLCEKILTQVQVSPLTLDAIEDRLEEMRTECLRLEGLGQSFTEPQ